MTLNELHINLGRIVREALTDHSRSRRELAERLGISESTMARRLSGERGFNMVEVMVTAAWLGEPAGDWMKRAGMDELAAA
ncbi:MAG: XRE family transcriptional regulator [Rhodococcus sp. (in: high G+C Gram-positive bacteria)]|nr:MAG: XRE family transcriptional regulator [Rhodococcus sp. (in: high G+C Gram-positive bacteria)]